VLYIVAFLALMNVLANLMIGNIYLVGIFLVIGYIVSCFSKNMVIVLSIPLFLVSTIMSGFAVQEGFAGKEDKKEDNKDSLIEPEEKSDSENNDSSDDTNPSESFEVGRKKQTRVDYGSTIEKAYDDLNNILGNEGISRLSEDTQKLMKQQVQLAEAMKGMSPMLEQAQSMLQSLNINELGDLGSIVKKLGVNAN